MRTASRLATGLNASWVAVTVQPVGREEGDPIKAKRVEDALRLAERLGGDTERLIGADLPAEVLAFAQRENITQIVIDAPAPACWRRWPAVRCPRRSCADRRTSACMW